MTGHTPLSAIVLTSNESQNLDECVRSVGWADELLLVDAFSTDGTSAQSDGTARVTERRFADFATQRQRALQLASYDWVLFVDADERVPTALAEEIRARAGHESHAGYWIPRRNRIFGRWMRASGWAPDRQLRLMDRRFATFDPDRPVHELARIQGTEGLLEATLDHLSYRSIRAFRARQLRYAAIEADALFAAGVRRRSTALAVQPIREFFRRFLSLQGYRDGFIGLLLAVLMAEHAWHVQRFLRARRRAARISEHGA